MIGLFKKGCKNGKMTPIQIIVLDKLRATSQKLVEWLKKEISNYNQFLINLPEAINLLLYKYINQKITIDEFWEKWKDLLNIDDHFIRALRYRFDPIIENLPLLCYTQPDIEIVAYQDNYHFEVLEKLKEDLFFMTFRTRSTGKIKLNEWMDFLYNDYELSKSFKYRNIKNILETLNKNKNSFILYEGFAKDLKEILEKSGYKSKIRYMNNYYRSPLEILSYLISLKGIENISKKHIEACIKEYLNYIDYVLLSPSLDKAHEQWVSKFKK